MQKLAIRQKTRMNKSTNKEALRIVFMGTPDFAVASLDALQKSDHQIVGVITAPDKPAGRGKKIRQSAIKVYAQENELITLQPTNLKDQEFQAELAGLGADLFVVVAFRMLPETIWAMPPKGTINLHGSLLPDYRGAAPINWAVMNGDQETGVTTFFIEKEIDTGMVIAQEKMSIGSNESAGEVHDRMMVLGSAALVKTVDAIASDLIEPIPQTDLDTPMRKAPKIFKPDCEIDWSKPAQEVHNHVRGLSPYPTAWTTAGDKTMKVFGGKIAMHLAEPPGKWIVNGDRLFVGCEDFGYELLELQLEGKKRMAVKDFLLGSKSLFEI